ncbi:unnamed protein product [Cyprideis torosa]|uniref:molybdopterin molybdotransferase n=1 Tax=Cyprideis torosa TaxID=163714 RepID=A0A7R8WVT0_9CRUS|nr:unnamed protein product [Cyprideis torosa]CAG0909926.1 unnamed protein product [Cyprideis torosa]
MKRGARQFNCAVVTLSDKGSVGEREDTSGASLKERLKLEGYRVEEYLVLPDNIGRIRQTLLYLIDERNIDLIVTTGGTGVAPTDVTPEAVSPLLDRVVPGLAEAMRAVSFQKTPHALLSRGVCGIRRQSLILTLPGSEKGAMENLEVVLPSLVHALEKIKGNPSDCGG